MKLRYERPGVVDFGSISAHTFMPVPPGSTNPVSHKGFVNCRVETTNCELSSPGEPGGGSP